MKFRKSFISLLVLFAIASIFYFNHFLNSGKAQFVKSDTHVNVSPIYTAESPEITILPEKKHKNYSDIITEKNLPDSIRLSVTDSLTLPENYVVKTEEINENINIQIPAAEADNPHELEVDNLVLNETISKTGKDFYDLFYKDWVLPEDAGNHTIVVQEKPLPSLGTRITIKVDDYYVYQRVLQPRYELIKEAAQIAVNTAASFIYNIKQIESNLQSEDMQGTGIY